MKIRRLKIFYVINPNIKNRRNLIYENNYCTSNDENLSEISRSSLNECIDSPIDLNGSMVLELQQTIENSTNQNLMKNKILKSNTINRKVHNIWKNGNYKFNSDLLVEETNNKISMTLAELFEKLDINGFSMKINQNIHNEKHASHDKRDSDVSYNYSPNNSVEKLNISTHEEENVALNRFQNPRSPDPENNYERSVQTTFIRPRDLKIINHILEILRIFHFNLKKKKSVNIVEYTVLENKEYFCYHYGLFADAMKEFKASAEFIYNSKMRTKSNYLFFYTSDFKFAIKTVKKSELQTAIDCIQSLYSHYKNNEKSFIVPIVGIYSTPQCYFIVMKNIFNNPYDTIFDLKGENINRRASFDSCILVEKDWKGTRLRVNNKSEIIDTIKKDSEFLRSLNFMDYSLIIGMNSKNNNEFRRYNSKGKDLGKISTRDINTVESYGIVDILTEYDWKKKLEHFLYKMCCCDNASCIEPNSYKQRFDNLIIRKVFYQEEQE